jgi:hypothetical protein
MARNDRKQSIPATAGGCVLAFYVQYTHDDGVFRDRFTAGSITTWQN